MVCCKLIHLTQRILQLILLFVDKFNDFDVIHNRKEQSTVTANGKRFPIKNKHTNKNNKLEISLMLICNLEI